MKRLAMIGCGGIGEYHLGHFLEFKDIELAGFCDLIVERAENFVKKAGSGKAYVNYLDMYNEVKPDMVFICIPPYAHGEIEFETIKRRIPFFVEKPVGLDLELAKKISTEIKTAGLITASGFQCRYSSLVEPNKAFVNQHPIAFIDCVRVGGIPEVPWWKSREQSGGQLVEQTIHQLDIIRYVFGEPDTVFTMGARGFIKDVEDFDTEDLTTTVVKFKNGTLATISTGCYATSGEAFESKVTFSAADCRADLTILDAFKVYGAAQKEDDNGLVVKGDGTLKSGGSNVVVYKEEVDAGVLCDRTFIDAVINNDGSQIRSPYEDAVKSLAFGLACNKSMDSGVAVKVEL